MKYLIWLFFCFFCIPTLAACNSNAATPSGGVAAQKTVSPPPDLTTAPAPQTTMANTLTSTARATPTSTPTLTATITHTSTPTLTPTFSFPAAVVNKQSHCRYGPNTAYLHAADLYTGDAGTVRGRFQLGKWLLVKFDKLNYFCWVAPSVVDVTGDINTVKFSEVYLPGPSVLYDPPQNVTASRDEAKVTIRWDEVPMTDDDDRGYFLDMFVCQDGAYLWYPVALNNRSVTSYTIKDEGGCPAKSYGSIYAVEKHGYTSAAGIDWPAP